MSHVAHLPPHVAPQAGAKDTLLFGAVRFELLSDFTDTGLLEEHRRFVERDSEGLALAHVAAALHAANRPRGAFAPEIVRSWRENRASISAGDVTTELVELAPGRFAASARLLPDDVSVSTFITSTTSAVVERLGGVILHATGITVGTGSVLFIGPSGAGKTTAAQHCPGASWIARDRAAVVPHGDGYVVFGMPGGDELDLPRARAAVHPLLGVARIRRDRDVPTVEALPLLDALAALRECTFAGGDEAAEEARLDALLALASRVRVVDLHTRLGEPLTRLVTEAFA